MKSEKAGLEEAGAGVTEGATVENLVVPWSGLQAHWYTRVNGQAIPTKLLDILDIEAERTLVPKANVSSATTLLIQEGTLSEEIMQTLQGLQQDGVAVATFRLESVPRLEPFVGHDYVYVMDVPVGSEREWVLDPSAMVINLRPAIPERRPASSAELGALINAARGAEGRILRVGGIYRSSLQDSVIAIDTQL